MLIAIVPFIPLLTYLTIRVAIKCGVVVDDGVPF